MLIIWNCFYLFDESGFFNYCLNVFVREWILLLVGDWWSCRLNFLIIVNMWLNILVWMFLYFSYIMVLVNV